jgi:rod shape-determining protein MreD
MRPISHQLFSLLPALFTIVLVFVAASPLDSTALTYTPNIAWLMTLVMTAFYPASWPRSLAFLLGLLQDLLFGTPLGSQALLALLLAQLTLMQAMRHQTPLFRVRWLEAAGVLVVWHIALWAIMHGVGMETATLRTLVIAGLVNAVWYPVFYWVVVRLFSPLAEG